MIRFASLHLRICLRAFSSTQKWHRQQRPNFSSLCFSFSPSTISFSHLPLQTSPTRPYTTPSLSRNPVCHSHFAPPVSSTMFVSRVLARASKTLPRSTLLFAAPQNHHLPILCNQSQALIHDFSIKFSPRQVFLLHHSTPSSSIAQIFGFSSSASPQPSEREHGSAAENGGASTNGEPAKAGGAAKLSDQTKESGHTSDSQSNKCPSVKRRRGGTKRTAFSDSDSEGEDDLSMDDLVKLVAEKEELLKEKHEEIKRMQDKVLRSYAEMENVMDRTRREAENSKKFAVQNFAKSLLDVADNLGRASSVVKDSFSKLDESKESGGAAPLLKTLLEGVEMTEKQLIEVFKKYGVEKFDPTNEAFDPNKHNAVFNLEDASKPPGTIAVVLKPGYMLYDRVVRPAEVGVTTAPENNATEDNAGN